DFLGKATLLIVSDHGFSPIRQIILPNVILRKAGLVVAGAKQGTTDAVQIVTQGGAAFVYVLDDAHHSEIIERINKSLQGMQGLSKIVDPENFKDYGVANPMDDPHAPDLILFAEEGSNFGDTTTKKLPLNDKPKRKNSH